MMSSTVTKPELVDVQVTINGTTAKLENWVIAIYAALSKEAQDGIAALAASLK